MMPDSDAIGDKTECRPELLQKICGNARNFCPSLSDIRGLVHDGLLNEQFGYGGSTFVVVTLVEDALQV
jgi:hypothetical protein